VQAVDPVGEKFIANLVYYVCIVNSLRVGGSLAYLADRYVRWGGGWDWEPL
jgi:hypothetical protein